MVNIQLPDNDWAYLWQKLHNERGCAILLAGRGIQLKKFDQIRTATIHGDAEGVSAGVHAILSEGIPPAQILDNSLIPAMSEVGDLFEKGKFYIPEMLVSERAMKAAMEIIRPHLIEADVRPLGKVVLGTVHGDMHDIGKNLVGVMLEGLGFEVVDIGVDIPTQTFLDAVKEHDPDIVGISALLSTTMPMMKNLVEGLKQQDIEVRAKVMVGGAPVTQAYADEIGADLYAPDAGAASRVAKEAMV